MRRRRRLVIRVKLVEGLIILGLFAVMVSALFRWPDKMIADVAIPTAGLIAFMLWRER